MRGHAKQKGEPAFLAKPNSLKDVRAPSENHSYVTSSRLTINAWFTLCSSSSSIWHIFSFSRCLSMVRNCSNNITEFLIMSHFRASSSTWVGNFALFIFDVMAAQITVGLCLLPMSFWIISTGLTPPCSDPTTGLKSA